MSKLKSIRRNKTKNALCVQSDTYKDSPSLSDDNHLMNIMKNYFINVIFAWIITPGNQFGNCLEMSINMIQIAFILKQILPSYSTENPL